MFKERNHLVEQIIFKNNKGVMDKDKKGVSTKKDRRGSKTKLKQYKGEDDGKED